MVSQAFRAPIMYASAKKVDNLIATIDLNENKTNDNT
jgi:hypothetical protein